MPDDLSGQPDRRLQGPLDPGVLVGSTDAEILARFLDLIRSWRGRQGRSAGQPQRLRAADVAVLVEILGTDSAEVERRLVAATACTPKAARRARRLLFASAGALALSLITAPQIETTSTFANTPLLDTTLPVATVDVVETWPAEAAPATTMPPSATPAAPPTVPVAPQADPSPISPVTPIPSETEAMVTIASIGIELPVVPGGQSVIDQGVVAHYWAAGWEPPVPAGARGTYWLAAHRTTHGEPFRTLPDLAVGAEIRVDTGNQTFVYTVTSMQVTGLFPGDEAVYGTDPTASTILLQTCVDGDRRLLVRGTLTATL
jgi:LPXTG-site transpeptidase (sortase) family protein